MSVTQISSPKEYDFSGNRTFVEFQCSDYMLVEPVYSVNTVKIGMLSLNQVITISYNEILFTVTAVLNPDDSGTQIYAGRPATDQLRTVFTTNYNLDNDFEMQVSGEYMIFTAKETGPEYDFLTYNTTSGVKGIYKENYGILVSIFCENADNSAFERIYNQIIPLFDKVGGKIKVQISDKLHDYITNDIRNLNPDIPTYNFIECKKSCRRFKVIYYEILDGVPQKLRGGAEYTIIHGALSDRAQLTTSLENILRPGASRSTDRFLKQGPRMVYTREDQPQYLYFFNTDLFNYSDAQLRVKYNFTDGSTNTIVLNTFDISSKRKYAFNVTFNSFYSVSSYPGLIVESYEVYLVNKFESRISETRSFTLNRQQKKYTRYFLNWSSFGSLDSRACFGEGSTELLVSQTLADRIQKETDIKRSSLFAFNVKGQSRFSVSTGFMSKADLILWRDFYLSALKYRLANGLLIPILLLTDSLKEIEDGSTLYGHQFEYRYLNEDSAYTEGDIEDSGKYYKNILFYNQQIPDGALVSEGGNIILSENQNFIV